MKDFTALYDGSYFEHRKSNDQKRLISFAQEKAFLLRHLDLNGRVCDVGCSTGEFLSAIDWAGPRHGVEINSEAIELARQSGIDFSQSILTEGAFFDVVVFRGTIQHLPDPFLYIQKAYESLKPGGHIVFLATPNANSLVYKVFNTLPALNPKYNFYIPSDVNLPDVLRNYDFEVVEIERPYLKSPYARPLMDHLNFIRCLITGSKPNFAFWGNMMNIIARKG